MEGSRFSFIPENLNQPSCLVAWTKVSIFIPFVHSISQRPLLKINSTRLTFAEILNSRAPAEILEGPGSLS